jgi:hypothetical protein
VEREPTDGSAMTSGAPEIELKYCIACGRDLTALPDDTTECPKCGRPYNPLNPSTYTDEPLTRDRSYWLQAPRLAGYGLVILFLVGRIIIGSTANGWTDAMDGQYGSAVVGQAAGAIIGALSIVLGYLPWIFVCCILALILLSDRFKPTLIMCLLLGMAAGLTLSLGLHLGLMIAAVMVGALAGLVYYWRVV